MRRRLLLLLMILFIFILFSGFFWIYEARYFVGRADVTRYSFSVDNSYVFVTPLQAKANGVEKVRVTIFVLNNQGLGVAGKTVVLGNNAEIKTDVINGTTDNVGKAIFDITSTKVGEYYLEVKVDDTALPQKAHITFN